MCLDRRFGDIRFLIRDHGSNFTRSFDAVFEATGATILRTAVQAPRMNATCERLAGTLRREVLDRVLILGQAHLRAVLTEYQSHYNTARPHTCIAQRVPEPVLDPLPGFPAVPGVAAGGQLAAAAFRPGGGQVEHGDAALAQVPTGEFRLDAVLAFPAASPSPRRPDRGARPRCPGPGRG